MYVHVCTYGAIIKEEVMSLREWAGHRKKLAGDAGNDGCRYSTSYEILFKRMSIESAGMKREIKTGSCRSLLGVE